MSATPQLRQLVEADLPLAMDLKLLAGWNQTEADWRRFLWLCPEGC
ncbi:MAG: GNAT family N-acetyltransferase, partial [Armatimonadetes bacterium]|nr:GNAT family N-acetyltransferase [Armatimonadota bacterium]